MVDAICVARETYDRYPVIITDTVPVARKVVTGVKLCVAHVEVPSLSGENS